MSNELERWSQAGSGLIPGRIPGREQRATARAVAHLTAETKFAGLKVDAEAALTGRIMERTVDIDTYRRSLAGGDETLNAVLTRIELGFIDKAVRLQRSFGSEFPL